jgi:hypothetical protein
MISDSRLQKKSVQAFIELLKDLRENEVLVELRITPDSGMGALLPESEI